MSASSTQPKRVPLLDELRRLVKSDIAIEASVVTTFAFDAPFYEEVLLRAFERAGSRLNIIIADARQLATAVNDPLRQPTRAGRDYLLAPVSLAGAFHPKVVALLSEKSSMLGIGSHNATNSGFGHNEEVTAFWRGPPQGILLDALEYCLFWLGKSGAAQGALLTDIELLMRRLGGIAKSAGKSESRFLGVHPETESLWAQTVRQIHSPVRRVSVVGPYFDRELQFLNRISQELNTDEIIVGLQPGTAVLEAPDAAPTGTRFVDAAAIGAFWAKADKVGFAHGKVTLFETDAGPVVSLGSANPTWAAWLGGQHSNAEANVLLTGTTAVRAMTELGMDLLPGAPSLPSETLRAIAIRSQADSQRQRDQEATRKSTPVLVGVRGIDAISVVGLDIKDCHSVIDLQEATEFQSTSFSMTANGGAFATQPPLKGGGLVRIDSADAPLAAVVVNDETTFRRQALPKSSAAVLDSLGRLDSYEGFDEVFDLIQRHVFDETEVSRTSSASKGNVSIGDETVPQAELVEAKAFGPRGVSVATLQKTERQSHLLSDGLVAELIAALIGSMRPVPKPALDGDGRNLDSDDAPPDERSEDEVAKGKDGDQLNVNWPRLVTACRKRIGVLINRLKNELNKPVPGPERAVWLFSRILLVLCLLQRLRMLPPASSVALDGHKRPASLVGIKQIREAFKITMQGMYRSPGIARILEESPAHRASDDRAMLDEILLWTAQEVGADYEEKPTFNEPHAEKERRLGDRADAVVVAMSAAAHPTNTRNLPSLRLWGDTIAIQPDWFDRHRALGMALQSGCAGIGLPTLNRRPKVGEFAFWNAEPGLPRLVRTLSGDKVTLFEPGGDSLSGTKIIAGYLDAIDLDSIVSRWRAEKARLA